jgi:outer membrane lipoprotein SlyB
MKNMKSIAAIAGAILIGGCAYNASPNNYQGYEVRGEQSVRFGIVQSVRQVRLDPGNTGIGAASGAALGGIAGSTVGGGSGQVAGAIGGALLGGIIGHNIEDSANAHPGLEITVQLDSGQFISVVQGADEPFNTGERVRILSGHGGTRVTH